MRRGCGDHAYSPCRRTRRPLPRARDRAPEQGLLTGPLCELCHLPIPAIKNGREGVNSSAPHAVIMTPLAPLRQGQVIGDCGRARPPDKQNPSASVPLPGQNPLRGGRAVYVRTDKRLDDHRTLTEARRPSRPTKDRTGEQGPFAQGNRPGQLPPLPTDGAGPRLTRPKS